jgi:hypothetical protein
MKFLLLPLLCLVAALVGCSTVNSRIEEKSAYFNTLDPQTQARIRESVVHVGDTTDMVYIALGHPDRIREKASGKGQELTWIYNTYWEEYEGTHFAGYRRQAFFDRRANAWRIYYEPVRTEIYSERTEEYMRVMFKDGRVTAIEQIHR